MSMTNDRPDVPPRLPLERKSMAERVASFVRSPVRGKVRRIYLAYLRPGYVRKQQKMKRGECRQCGACCRLIFRCPFLLGDSRCAIYDACRTDVCTMFPMDARDLGDLPVQCGYYFEEAAASGKTPFTG